MGVEQCNHCYFWRKACHKKACYTSHLTERSGWFSVCVVPSLPPFYFSIELNLLSRTVLNAKQVHLYFKSAAL